MSDTVTDAEVRAIRRPAEPTSDPLVDLTNEVHSLKGDMAEMEDRLIERMDARFTKLHDRISGVEEHMDERFDDLEKLIRGS